MAIDWSLFVELVESNQRFLLTSHIRPDCDALGSELGMAAVLEAAGKQVRIVNGDGTPPNLAFLDPGNRLEAIEDLEGDPSADVDVLMVLDTSAWVQLGGMADVVRQTSATRVVLDHHKSGDDLGATELKDVSAEATGALVVEAADALGVPLTAAIARPLFAAIATDTGWFRFPSTSSRTYQVAGRLTEAGASPAEIYGQLYEQETLARLNLRGLVLARVQTECEGALAYTHIRLADFEQTGALPSDTEDLVNLSLTIKGTQAAVILVEQQAGVYKVSFRSRCQMDCSEVAAEFNGGGHQAAAGGSVEGDFKDVLRRVLDAVGSRLA
jgi:phosphoesterase RecJ-like protein